VNNVSYANPMTGDATCPVGYQANIIYGSTGAQGTTVTDNRVAVCWKRVTASDALPVAAPVRLHAESTGQCLYSNQPGNVTHWGCYSDPNEEYILDSVPQTASCPSGQTPACESGSGGAIAPTCMVPSENNPNLLAPSGTAPTCGSGAPTCGANAVLPTCSTLTHMRHRRTGLCAYVAPKSPGAYASAIDADFCSDDPKFNVVLDPLGTTSAGVPRAQLQFVSSGGCPLTSSTNGDATANWGCGDQTVFDLDSAKP